MGSRRTMNCETRVDSVPWELMLRAVTRHSDQKWVVMYVERWLKTPMQRPDGTLVARVKGTPQGSPISPVLANLFLHYGLDAWMAREFPTIQFGRDRVPRRLDYVGSGVRLLMLSASLSFLKP
jgi:retron-type reverse transcriptase